MLDAVLSAGLTVFPLIFAAFAGFAVWVAIRAWPSMTRAERISAMAFIAPLVAVAIAAVLTMVRLA